MTLIAGARRQRRESALSLRRRVSGFEDEAWISRWSSVNVSDAASAFG
ncbi:hypothetical protein [Mycobacterium ostraviense]|nr:hypothetical protein [Mycobacterium ostraviense]UGT89918.1 hypothetical protein LTS72_16015 [Mycobacterium ostraviense]